MDDANPQSAIEQREAARHLLQHPLTCAEQEPDVFRLIRRHEATIDRWFTQRLGYRLHVDTDTARLFKTTYLPAARPLRVASRSARPLRPLEHTMLALVFASTAAGPSVVSLRDLVAEVRSAAAEAEIDLAGDATERRALVTALRWMIDNGLATELHDHVDAYSNDEEADAILRVRPDRIALVPLPALAGADGVEDLFAGSGRGTAVRQWLRCRLTEDPVLYRTDCTEEEWAELRRRLGEDAALLEEMFGLVIEARAEGVAAIDPTGRLSDQRFPAGGTVGHAALLLIDAMVERRTDDTDGWMPVADVVTIVEGLVVANARRWRGELVEAPDRLTTEAIDLLSELRLAERAEVGGRDLVRLQPIAARFTVDVEDAPEPDPTLW